MLARVRSVRTRPAGAYAAVGVVLSGVYFTLARGSIAQSVIYDGLAAAAAAAVLAGIALNRPARRLPWLLFAAGQALFAAGEVTFDVYARVLNRTPPLPSLADVFYLGAYPLIAAGLGLLIAGLGARRRLPGFGDAAIVSLAFALAQWVFLMQPHLQERGLSAAGRAVALAYPAADIVLLAALAAFFVTPIWRIPAYRYLALSLGLLLGADEIYGVSPEAYASGDWVDLGWMLAYTLWAAAALHPSMARLGRTRRPGRRRISAWQLALLAGALLAPAAILLSQKLRGAPLEVEAVVAAAGAISLLVVARLTGIVRALERLRLRERAARGEAEAAQRRLAEQNARLREADQLKDEFVALISHDLRTPLTSIIGFLELALDQESGPLNQEQRSYLEVVARNSERLLRLVDDLLFAARLQAGRLELAAEMLDLGAIVEQSVAEARPRAEAKGIELALTLGAAPPIEGDRGRLFQLLDNLISNALKFTPAGGRVTIALAAAGGRVRLEVRDTGIGIPPEELARLFERFFRASTAVERQIPGTGLGLYIARAIVEAHQGTIGLESTVGTGSSFSIELPAAVRHPRPARELVS